MATLPRNFGNNAVPIGEKNTLCSTNVGSAEGFETTAYAQPLTSAA